MILNVLSKNQIDSQNESKIDLSHSIDPSGSNRFLLGRGKTCFVVLNDRQVSREHAEIIFENQKWFVKSLSKFSQVILNGRKVESAELKNEDEIEIGPFLILIENQSQNTQTFIEDKKEEFLENTEEHSFNDLDDNQENEESLPSVQNELEEGSLSEEEQYDEFDEESHLPFDNDFENDDKTEVIDSFAKYSLEIFGEYAPYDTYKIFKQEIFIGRSGTDCEIAISDPEVSKKHALIKKEGGSLYLTDLDSGNGTLLNGKRVNQAEIFPEDEFIIGSTTFTVKVDSRFLKGENKNLMPVEKGQFIEVEEVVEVEEDINLLDTNTDDDANEKSILKRIFKNPEKRKKAIYVIVGLTLAWVMFSEEEVEAPKKSDKTAKEIATKIKEGLENEDLDKKYSKEEKEFLEQNYYLALNLLKDGRFKDALLKIEQVMNVDKNYRGGRANMIYQSALSSLAEIEKLEKIRQAEIEAKIIDERVKGLVEKGWAATKERNIILAEGLFSQIIKLRPENLDVKDMKRELDAWKAEQERIALEKAEKEADRKRKLKKLAPGKQFFLNKKWHQAILRLSEFIQIPGMDEDLLTEASDMLNQSKDNLSNIISPMIGKARSLREGQDLKGAYQIYLDVLKHDPAHTESLNEMNDIREKLKLRSMRVYRSALVSESLNLFNDAKEKFQEVQQISPSDSEYYEKATLKLKDYIDY